MAKLVLKGGMIAVLLLVIVAQLNAQTNQISISRVSQMPNLPSPYVMRDWKTVAIKYDEFIFSMNSVGTYLPVMHLKSNGINYPSIQPILLDTYVGSVSTGNQAEAINIIPSMIGATLVGVDKSNQNGINWVEKAKDFFNKTNGQNVYLNGYSTTSGNDWWYDLMPNVFFYQLYSHYPDVPDFKVQFTTVADRWLAAVNVMGASTTPWNIPVMNYRAWKLGSMTPLTTGVIEAESAGTIAWLLYHAYLHIGEEKYLIGAQQSMDFLSALNTNPAYELQLPYGAFVAAKMNAELGTHYDIEKMVNWCFDRGSVRDWGVIVGKWNGSDVSGLIGEANNAGNDYAFAMNGFQQAAALVPMVKYDKRFARDIAKWMLNLSNASRLFYSQYLPQADQDDYNWSSQFDPQSVIGYEALKENLNGRKLYGTGDAKREGWGQTNLGLYGSSHVGYLGAIIEATDVEGILKLDMNKTDFFGENPFPSYLIYNPYAEVKQVTLSLGAQTYDIYNAISETLIKTNATGNIVIDALANEVMMLVYLPSGSTLEEREGKLYLGDQIVDNNFGYHFEGKLRIKSLAAADTLIEFNQSSTIYSTIENATTTALYNWYVNETLSGSSANSNFTWTASEVEGNYTVKLILTSGVSSAMDSIVFRVIENIPIPPEITGFKIDSLWYYSGSTATVICQVVPDPGNSFQYKWTLPAGMVIHQNDSLLRWSLPQQEGLFVLSCEVSNKEGLKATSTMHVLVKKKSTGITTPFAYYPLDGDVLDYSGNGHHAKLEGAQPTADSRGEPNKAYLFSSGTDLISVANEVKLNFKDQITLSFWVKLNAITQESFIISHGSWEERWKVSVTPDKKLRWTIKTSSGTKDLDSSFPLQLNHYYHFAVVYTGYTVELYADGLLDTFLPHQGAIAVTDKALTFGRKDTGTTNYFLRGSLDEVRLYNASLAPDEINKLRSTWNTVTAVDDPEESILLYPNPFQTSFYVMGIPREAIQDFKIFRTNGQSVAFTMSSLDGHLKVTLEDPIDGLLIIKIQTPNGVYYNKMVYRQ